MGAYSWVWSSEVRPWRNMQVWTPPGRAQRGSKESRILPRRVQTEQGTKRMVRGGRAPVPKEKPEGAEGEPGEAARAAI